MAFPWVFESNFEQGNADEWGSESDTGGLLDFPHYTTLAAIPGMGLPFRGAYCMRIDCGDTNDHVLIEGDMNIADTGTAWVRFYLYIHKDFAATANDIFNIFEWQQAGGTAEAVISLQITAATNLVEIAIADGTEASSGFTELTKGTWHHIEALFTVDVTPGTDGVLTLRLDDFQIQTVTGHNQAAAIGRGVLGTQNTASTTTGVLLFDQFIFDELQIFPFKRRYVENVLVTKDQHLFVGNGRIENITLMSGNGTNNVVTIYDTDTADTNDASNIVAELKNTAANEVVDPAGMPVSVTRGAYVVMTGTDPRALVQLGLAQGWGSEGAIRTYASRRSG